MTRRLVLRIQRRTHTWVGPCRCASLFLRFKLLGERSDVRGDGRVRDRGLVPNGRQGAFRGGGIGLVWGSPFGPGRAGGWGGPRGSAGEKSVAWTRRRIQESIRSAVRATDMRAPSLRVEGRLRQADHRLPLELNCQSEKLNPLAAAR